MAEEYVKLGKDFRTTIPKIAREVLELKEGDIVVFKSDLKRGIVCIEKKK